MNSKLIYQIIKNQLLTDGIATLPSIGKIEVKDIPATFTNNGKHILPPSKELIFNRIDINPAITPGISLDKEYATKMGIPISEATAHIEDFINVVKQKLAKEGSFYLEGIGTISLEKESRQYKITKDETFEIFTEGYGLQPVDTEKENSSQFGPGLKALCTIAIILAVIAIGAALAYIFRDSLRPLLEEILYSTDELDIVKH